MDRRETDSEHRDKATSWSGKSQPRVQTSKLAMSEANMEVEAVVQKAGDLETRGCKATWR